MSLGAMSRADACPRCCTNVEVPYAARPGPDPAGFTAYYTCHDCGWVWRTCWRT